MKTPIPRLIFLGLLAAVSIYCTSSSQSQPTQPTQPTPVNIGPWGTLWTGVQPPGTSGHATLGDNWDTQTLTAYTGVSFTSPPLEAARVFDLMDRGFDPQGALNWMNGNGYLTSGVYYPAVGVIGFSTVYMAFIKERWDLVLRVGA